MNIRFVDGGTLISDLIEDREGVCLPFCPSHVEICVPGGYLGAHEEGGVAIRLAGYKPFRNEMFVDVPLPDEKAADTYARSIIGQPYDWTAILDFVLPVDWHESRHKICSAFVTLALDHGSFWPKALAVPAHAISPRDLLLMLSTHIAIPEIKAAASKSE
jgi:hypothetical protein